MSHTWNTDQKLYQYDAQRDLLFDGQERNDRVHSGWDLRWRVAARPQRERLADVQKQYR